MPKKQKKEQKVEGPVAAAAGLNEGAAIIEIVSPDGNTKLFVGVKAFELIYKAEGFKIAK